MTRAGLPLLFRYLTLGLCVALSALVGCGGGGSVARVRSANVTPAPTLSTVTPSSGPSAGGVDVTVTGTGFQAGCTVAVGGTAATKVVFNSSTQLVVTTPAHQPASADISVTNPDGQTSILASAFQFVAPPAITSESPAYGPLS